MTENNFDPNTGEPLNGGNKAEQPAPESQVYQESTQQQYNPNPAPMPQQYGQPNPYQTVPPEIRKWNWGAFSFNVWWGIGNKAYLTLLCLIPCFNLIWYFVCGAKGNEWAWKSGEFKDVEQFMAAQRTWNRAGLVCFIINIAGVALVLIFYAAIIALLTPFIDDYASSYVYQY
jgi:hypothetical protein